MAPEREHPFRAADGQDPGATPESYPGWQILPPEPLPRPTYWPAVLALAITLLLWGVVTTFLISGVGLALFALALAGWIGELRHGQ